MRIVFTCFFALTLSSFAQAPQRPKLSEQEQPVFDQIRTLRKTPDAERGALTRKLALQIRALPQTPQRLTLAGNLANLATEGDFGKETLQEVATTLAAALRDTPPPEGRGSDPYSTLAQLVYYEHVNASLDTPRFTAAMDQLKADDRARQEADFTLTDLNGKPWHLKELKGKVVLLNFWATWCPPCRKEMPDLEKLYQRFASQGLLVLAISDEEVAKVKPFIADTKYTYPVLLDAGGDVAKRFRVNGIPKNFVFNRDGKLVAQSIDMRTEHQFLEMLAAAGLK